MKSLHQIKAINKRAKHYKRRKKKDKGCMPFFEVALVTLGGGGKAEGAFSVVAGAEAEIEGVMSLVLLGWA